VRIRVGVALLLAIAAAGALVILLGGRGETPPSRTDEPRGLVPPESEPVRLPPTPEPAPTEPEPTDPTVEVEVPTPPPDKVETEPPAEVAPPPPPPDPVVEKTPEPTKAPDPVVEKEPEPPVARDPVVKEAPKTTSPEKPPEEKPALVAGTEAAPLPGPVDDPADLPTPEEIEEREPPAPGKSRPVRDSALAAVNSALRIMTADGRIQFKVTGRLYLDAALMNAEQNLEDLVGDFESGGEFRAARIGLLGVMEFVEFKIDYDIAGGDTLVGEPDLKDLWIGVRDVPVVGRLRFGRMKEPLGLEQWMSGNARTFMEPALPKALTIGRNPGLLAFDTTLSGRLCWWAGVFGHTQDNRQVGSLGANISARVTGTPWYEEKGRKLLHLGISGSYRPSHSDEMSIASRPEVHLAPTIVGTPEFTAARQHFLGVEAALMNGPYSLQGEVQHYSVDTTGDGGRSNFWGAYLYGSVILTGEHRVYRNGQFRRPRVAKFAFEDGLGGAWELAARVSHLDLSSGDMDGGVVTDATLGLTWYTDNHSRFMINYVHSHRRSVGSANILACRLQIDF